MNVSACVVSRSPLCLRICARAAGREASWDPSRAAPAAPEGAARGLSRFLRWSSCTGLRFSPASHLKVKLLLSVSRDSHIIKMNTYKEHTMSKNVSNIRRLLHCIPTPASWVTLLHPLWRVTKLRQLLEKFSGLATPLPKFVSLGLPLLWVVDGLEMTCSETCAMTIV